MNPNETSVNERGATVCRRVIKAAIQNVQGDDSKGFHYVDAYCGKPVVANLTTKQKMCPSCDKQPVIGWPEPRVTNAAGVKLTPKELQECGVTDGEDPSLKTAAPRIEVEISKAVEAKMEVKKDEVVLSIPLKDLEGDTDVAAFLIKKVIEGFGTLPVTNFAESKRLIRLEEKLQSMLGA